MRGLIAEGDPNLAAYLERKLKAEASQSARILSGTDKRGGPATHFTRNNAPSRSSRGDLIKAL